MNVDVFLDTNVLVYAHDRDAGEKHEQARALVESFWMNREQPCLSVQVLQGLHVNLVRKGLETTASAKVVSRYFSWRVVDNTRPLTRQAFSVQEEHKISFWDALIIAAAQRAGVSTLWTENLNMGQNYGGVRVVNPLLHERDP